MEIYDNWVHTVDFRFSTVSCISELIPESGARRDGAKMTKTTLIFSVGMENDCLNVFTCTFFFLMGFPVQLFLSNREFG